MKKEEIPNGELFADLQVSFTEIVLVDILEERSQLPKGYTLQNRRSANKKIVERIKAIMKKRFSQNDIYTFLEKGFPREVNLAKIVR